jgi:hypothetical protein
MKNVNMTQTEALRFAWEALTYINEGANNQGAHIGISWRCAANKSAEAITAIKAALEAKDEPVIDESAAKRIATALGWEPKRTWVGLTDDDEIDWDGGDLKSFVKAIEAKLREKNT